MTAARQPSPIPDRACAGLDSGELTTPALVVDRTVLIRNIRAMAARADGAGVSLWPHAKTHKSPEIAREQLTAGAGGVTVATVAEAETMVAAGVENLLLAYPPVDEWRLQRIAALAGTANVTVTLDDVGTALALDAACAAADLEVRFLWEVDCGNRRCGSAPGDETAECVGAALAGCSHARYAGLMTFAGHAYGARNDAELREIARAEVAAVRSTAEVLRRRGIESPVLSIGSTPTVRHLADGTAGMQIRPGNYVFNDATQVALDTAAVGDCALTVLTTVISRPSRDRVIFDSGSKAMSGERMTDRTDGFGIVRSVAGVRIERLFEEHAIASVDPDCPLEVGDRVRVIPNHACTTANLHTSMLVVQDGRMIDVWPIAARGWA